MGKAGRPESGDGEQQLVKAEPPDEGCTVGGKGVRGGWSNSKNEQSSISK